MVEVNVGLMLISLFITLAVVVVLLVVLREKGIQPSLQIITILLLVWVILILIPIADFAAAFTELINAVG